MNTIAPQFHAASAGYNQHPMQAILPATTGVHAAGSNNSKLLTLPGPQNDIATLVASLVQTMAMLVEKLVSMLPSPAQQSTASGVVANTHSQPGAVPQNGNLIEQSEKMAGGSWFSRITDYVDVAKSLFKQGKEIWDAVQGNGFGIWNGIKTIASQAGSWIKGLF